MVAQPLGSGDRCRYLAVIPINENLDSQSPCGDHNDWSGRCFVHRACSNARLEAELKCTHERELAEKESALAVQHNVEHLLRNN